MIENYLYRIIKSRDKTYVLLPDRLVELNEREFAGGGGRYQTICVASNANQLSKKVIRKMFKTGAGKTRRWNYSMSPTGDLLSIGCQHFDSIAIYAMKKWLGIKI